MLACTILTFALCADPQVDGAIAFGDVTVPIVWSHVAVGSCAEIGMQTSGESGLATVETMWHTVQTEQTAGLVSGHIVAKLSAAHIDMTAFSWDHMSAADRAALAGGYRATLWHEIGHLRTAQASIAAINAEAGFSAPTVSEYNALANKRGQAMIERLNADQNEYDRVAEHGLRQDTLPPPLAGPDTIVECPSGGGRRR
jgi:hypothetical protein